jgi:hypothetical protein
MNGNLSAMAAVLVVGVILSVGGCSSHLVNAQKRNTVETVAVTNTSDSIAPGNVEFVLELRDSRQTVSYAGLEEFLSSESAAHLSRSVKTELTSKTDKVNKTIFEAGAHPSGEIVLARPDGAKPYSRENIVLYLKGQDGYDLYFSTDEIDQVFLLMQTRMESDLETVVYVHPKYKSETITALRTELRARGIELEHGVLSQKEKEELKVMTAAGILEKKLRSLGVALHPDKPILKKGLWGKMSSPKLTAAFANEAVLNRITESGDPAVVRSFNYLVEKQVITLRQDS